MSEQPPQARFWEDDLLRSRRFTVYLRPRNREALWQRDGMIFTFALALQKAKAEVAEERDRPKY